MTTDMKKRGLGRGLDALFRDSKSEEEAFAKPAPAALKNDTVSAPAAPVASAAVMRADEMVEASRRLMQQQAAPAIKGAGPAPAEQKSALPPASGDPVRKLGVEKLVPGKFQPRRLFNEEELDQLADSIRQHGVLQPLIVRPLNNVAGTATGEGMFEIIGGERRWRAAQKAQVHEVPVVIRALSDKDALEIGLIENLQREDLTPIEEAEGYQRLIDDFRHTHDTLAYQLGRSRSHVANLLRLLRLPTPVKEMIQSGVLSAGHARALVGAQNAEELAREIARKGLSVRQAEKYAQGEATGSRRQRPRAASAPVTKDVDVLALEQKMTALLGLNVTIEGSGTEGRIIVAYKTLEQLDDLLARLSSVPGKN